MGEAGSMANATAKPSPAYARASVPRPDFALALGGGFGTLVLLMGDFFKIMHFGMPYLRQYWLRFALGIVFGVLFGLSNGLTMGGVYLMLGRLGGSSHNEKAIQQEHVDAAHAALAAQQRTIDDQQDRVNAALKQLAAHPADEGDPTGMQKIHDWWTHLSFVQETGAGVQNFGHQFSATIDSWLPLAGRALDWKQVVGGLLLFPIVAGFRGLMNYLTTYCLAWVGQRISNDIREDVFRKISSFSLEFFHRPANTTAALMSRIGDDPGAVNACLKMGLSDMIKEPTTIVVLFCGLLWIDWKLTMLALLFAPLCVFPTLKISKRIKSQGRQDNLAWIQQSGAAMESFQNVRVTKAYDLAETQAGLFRKWGNRASHFMMKTTQARAMLNPVIETLNSFGMGIVLLYAVWAGVSIQVLSSFLVALVFFFTPFKKLSTIQVYFTQAGLAIERLMALMAEEPSVREPANPKPLLPFARSLEFNRVGFSYGDGPVLENITISVPRGRRLGLAGESGSGKSSLLNLLFRFYDPTAGEIALDGVPIDQYRFADLRSQFALVSQDVLLFNTTVAENIGYGKKGATREEIIAAAKEAYAHDFISALPQGYDTPLGERGLRLSGGQRQRIAIARAFVRNAPILVLDEATASLDSQAEAEVQKAIDHLVENRTVICVAHRLSTLRGMDRIVVLQSGRIVETGGFDELLAKRGIFAAMAARQGMGPKGGDGLDLAA
jgi:ABC-type multidrug transport system fused ATPase/permease subunit